MSKIIIRKGLETDRLNITPSNGELIYTTDEKLIYMGDGIVAGGIAINPSSSSLLTSILTVDGSGSGLDADFLDGIDSVNFLRSDISDDFNGQILNLTHGAAILTFDTAGVDGLGIKRITCNDGGGNWNFRAGNYFNTTTKYLTTGDGAVHQVLNSDSQNGNWTVYTAGTGNVNDPVVWDSFIQLTNTTFAVSANMTITGTVDGRDISVDGSKLDGIASNAAPDQTATEILTLIQTVHGSGSGLDADFLDGIDSTQFLRSDVDDIATKLTIGTALYGNYNSTNTDITALILGSSAGALIEAPQNAQIAIGIRGNDALDSFSVISKSAFGANYDKKVFSVTGTGVIETDGNKIWHEGNDGAGTGLDADLLDGRQASVTATASTIVERHSAGYIYANFFNTSPNTVTAGDGITQVCIETGNDGFIRHSDAAGVREFLNVSDGATAGGGAKTVSYMSKSGHNSQILIIDGKVYTTHGLATDYNTSTSGRGITGQCGIYGTDNFKEVPIPSSANIVKVGGGYHSVMWALMDDDTLYTWGKNTTGQCGLGHNIAVPTPILASTNVVDVYDHPSNGGWSVDQNRLYVKSSDGFVYAVGYNGFGAFGNGNTTSTNIFTKLTALGSNVIGFWNMGATYGCAVAQKSDHTIWVAGYGGHGQLGNASVVAANSNWINVTTAWGGASGFILKQVIGGFGYNNGAVSSRSGLGMLLDNGTTTIFRMSGDGTDGNIGNGSNANVSTPATPNVGAGRIGKVAFEGALGGIKVLKEDNNMYAWGRNAEGQIGDGTFLSKNVPALLLSGVADLYSDGMDSHLWGYRIQSFIKKTDGKLYGTGYHDSSGYLGTGITTSNNTFQRTLLPDNIDIQDLGNFTTGAHGRAFIAKGLNNKLYAWGYNFRLGINISSTANVLAPIQIELTEDNV